MPLMVEFFAHIARDRNAYHAYLAGREEYMKKFGLNTDQCRCILDAHGHDASHPAVGKLEDEMAKEHQKNLGGTSTATSTYILSMTTKTSP